MTRRTVRTGALTAAAASTALLLGACGGADPSPDPDPQPGEGAGSEGVTEPPVEAEGAADTGGTGGTEVDGGTSGTEGDGTDDAEHTDQTADAGGAGTDDDEAPAEEGAGPEDVQDVEWVDEVLNMEGIYFAVDGEDGPELVRELVTTPSNLDEIVGYLTTEPYDPDHRTLVDGWVESVEHEDDEFVVVVDGGAPEGTEAERAMAVQQVVYTLQTTQDSSDPVRFVTGDGALLPPTDLGGQDNPAGAAPQTQALAAVNITTPGEGGYMLPGQSTVSGRASAEDGVVTVQLVDPDAPDTPLLEDTVELQADSSQVLVPWAIDLDLSGVEPGELELVATTVDADGDTSAETRAVVVEDSGR